MISDSQYYTGHYIIIYERLAIAGTAKVPHTKYGRASPAGDAKHRTPSGTRSTFLASRHSYSTGFRTRVCSLVHDYSHTTMIVQYNSRSIHASASLGTTQYLFSRATQSQMFDPRRSSLRARSYTTLQARHTSSWPYIPLDLWSVRFYRMNATLHASESSLDDGPIVHVGHWAFGNLSRAFLVPVYRFSGTSQMVY